MMNIQENIRRILNEVRVPRNERVELYKDDNIIVVVPLTHRALQKYAHKCQWCINDDRGEWEDYHQKKHVVIIQRNPKKPKIGITGNPTASEILVMGRWDEGGYKFEDVCDILNYQFKDDQEMGDYYITTSNDINNFATNIVYYSPENGVYDMEDNPLWDFNIKINDIPNVTPEVIKIMDDYLQENEEMSLQENIRRILREERNHSKLIVKLLNRLVVSKYEDVCKIEVVHPSVDSDYNFYRVFVYFNQHGKNGTKYWEENILDEVWQYVYDTFGISIALHSVRVISCDDDNYNMNLQENIRKVLREEVGSVDMKTTQTELTNILGPSKIKNGNRVEYKNNFGSFDSSFDIIVDRLDQKTLVFINKFMSERGWFPTNIGIPDMKKHIYSKSVQNYIGQDGVEIGYESNTGKEISLNQSKVYHVSPDIFVNGIIENGIILKSESKLGNHPERIYLYLNKDNSKDMITTIWSSISQERKQTIKDYYVLEIDLSQIPNHKFYHDPASMVTLGAIYTNQSIPKSAVKVIDKINTNDLKTYDEDETMTPEQERKEKEERKRKEEERIKKEKEDSENKKSYDQIPDNIKNMSIDDLFESKNIQENIRRILREDKKTKSTNKEFSKYKDSKFNSLRDYTLQDIVDNWESLSDKKNENIKTIKHFINNPDKITDLVYDDKGLEDGYHRLIAAKILKKPRFTYRLVENLQENIRRVLREDINSVYLKRRYHCFEDFITKLENGEDMIPQVMLDMSWDHSQIIIVAYMRMYCGEGGYFDQNLHDIIMSGYGDRLGKIHTKLRIR